MTDQRFPDVPGGYPFPQLELGVIEKWQREGTFQRTLEKPAWRGEFVQYEGPPTANNVPHMGHVLTRVVKDLFPRYRTMRGYHVARKAGWDTHGLPVEIEVEKRLGFSGKKQIEEYGIAEFNQACLESVQTYEKQWRKMTERVGYWTDLDHAYFTYTNEYVESVWWSLKQLADKGLLDRGYKIQPYCARCGTSLSSHEVAQNYQDAEDPSVWVLFPTRSGQPIQTVDGDSWETPAGLHLVAWTTTPWTLTAHVALAVHPELIYRVVEHPELPGKFLLFGDTLETPVPYLKETAGGKPERLDLRDLPPVARFTGAALKGLRYERPFATVLADAPAVEATEEALDPPPSDEHGFVVLTADYITATEGTGLVHTAPPYGEDDYQLGKRHGLPVLLTVGTDGKIRSAEGIEPFADLWFKDADPPITRDLKQRGRLLHGERYHHNYPFCWRCDTPLLYYATESWFVLTTRVKDRLVALNKTINWHPEHVGEGRFGNWLENVVDWALSRNRYWGTPLPVWECDACGDRTVIGSYQELFETAGREAPADLYDREQFDPHRPFIDAFTWACARGGCGGTTRRVEEVIDAWYDSGSMPFAQHHYPFAEGDLFDRQFPADLIAEAVDQTRGWFYTLHALGTLLFDSVAYKHCIVFGHVNDETGRKMSKRLGNVVEPMGVLEETGADAIRWYFYGANVELPSRFSSRLVREAAQNLLLPVWNALSFFTIYANIDGWRPARKDDGDAAIPFSDRPALDRWILLRLRRLVEETTDHLESYRLMDAARGIETFVDELTNWYIRRSRGRFWAPEDADAATLESKTAAYQTLYTVLTTLTRLLAPFTPFVAEVLHEHLERSQRLGAESIHLEDWPEPDASHREDALEEAMGAVLRIVRLGHAARNSHGLKTRQPLAAVTLVTAHEALPRLLASYTDLLQQELNVHAIRWAEDRAVYVHHEVKPFFPKCGPRFGKQMKEVQQALAQSDGDALAEKLEAAGKITLELSTGAVDLSPEEVEVRLIEREGTATQGDRELLVVLDTELTPELIAEGWAREVVSRIQNARKEADLDYADRIRVRYTAEGDLAAAIAAHRDSIAGETLAVALELVENAESGDRWVASAVEGMAFGFGIETV